MESRGFPPNQADALKRQRQGTIRQRQGVEWAKPAASIGKHSYDD
jgi:hypothetical protein